MKIKALVLWDPWAWLCRLGLKEYETRGWGTSYRGPLLICAAKRPVERLYLERINFVLESHGHARIRIKDLCPGHAVALVDLVADICCVCGPEGMITPQNLSPMEEAFGDFSKGRHALKMANHRDITPFPVRGYQGLFEVEIPEGLI